MFLIINKSVISCYNESVLFLAVKMENGIVDELNKLFNIIAE